jgi:hypothetical protein
LQSLSGYTETQTNPLVYAIDSSVQISFSEPPTLLTRSNFWTQPSGHAGALTKIRFQPDGFISDTSPQNIYFHEQNGSSEIWIAETSTHLRYEIEPGPPPQRR